MNQLLFSIFESILLVTALSTDALIASLAYGSNKIRIPFVSALIIALICTGFLGFSLLIGVLLKPFLPLGLLKVVSFLILFLLGVTRLMDNIIKSLINKNSNLSKEIKFTLFDLKFILNIYADPKEADIDKSKILSPKEASSLAIALSIDSLTAGIGAALGNVNVLSVVTVSFLFSFLAVKSGEYIGCRLLSKLPFQLSWLSGLLLICLAAFRFL